MLMICSSLARNRSADPVVSCCFGRIVASDAARESWFRLKEKLNRKVLGPQAMKSCNLKSAKAPKTDSHSIG